MFFFLSRPGCHESSSASSCLPSPFLSHVRLPDVYLRHKDIALMMPAGCQYNQRAILFIYTSCQRPKAYKLHLQRLQHEMAPTSQLSFLPCYQDKGTNKSSVNTVWHCLWIDPCVCSVFTCANSLLFWRSLSEAALMIAADDRFRCIVGNGLERAVDFRVKIDILSLILFWVLVVNN